LKKLLGKQIVVVVATLNGDLLEVCSQDHFVDVLSWKQKLIDHNEKICTIIEKTDLAIEGIDYFLFEIVRKCCHQKDGEDMHIVGVPFCEKGFLFSLKMLPDVNDKLLDILVIASGNAMKTSNIKKILAFIVASNGTMPSSYQKVP